MAEYINRTEAIEQIRLVSCKDCKSYNGILCRTCPLDDAMMYIEDYPTVDVAEVIRCKDCRFYGVDRNKRGFCMRPWSPSMWRDETGHLHPDDYCSYAVRKEQT